MAKMMLELVIQLAMVILVECHVQSQTIPSNQNEPMPITLVNMTNDEIKAYDRNPANKPKLDFKPTGKIAQPKTAGKSYLKASKQIAGGSRAAQTQFPWQVLVTSSKTILCGGSLIAANWVLTAAHCVKGEITLTVTAGGIDRISVETGEKTQTSQTFQMFTGFIPRYLVNDIAVIKMPSNFVLNQYVNVVRLPRASYANRTFEGYVLTIGGYGKTSRFGTGSDSSYLNYIDQTVISNTFCAALFGANYVTSTTMCTNTDPNKALCNGDGGNPLVFRESDGYYTQVGIVSYGFATSCAGYPAIHTRVTSFLGWISSVTGIAIAA